MIGPSKKCQLCGKDKSEGGWRQRMKDARTAIQRLHELGIVDAEMVTAFEEKTSLIEDPVIAELSDQIEERLIELGIPVSAGSLVNDILRARWAADEAKRLVNSNDDNEDSLAVFRDPGKVALRAMVAGCRYLGIENGNMKRIIGKLMDGFLNGPEDDEGGGE